LLKVFCFNYFFGVLIALSIFIQPKTVFSINSTIFRFL